MSRDTFGSGGSCSAVSYAAAGGGACIWVSLRADALRDFGLLNVARSERYEWRRRAQAFCIVMQAAPHAASQPGRHSRCGCTETIPVTRVHRDHSRHTRGLRATTCDQVQSPGPEGWPRGAGTPDDSLHRQLTRRPSGAWFQPAATRKSTRAGRPTSRQGLEGTGWWQCTGLTSKRAM